jgi:hypothetical protein
MSQKIKTSVEIDGSLTASQIANATTDTDKFLVSDGGVVKYRTGAEMLSDLGVSTGTANRIQHPVKAGVSIFKGQAVYVTDADGTNMIVGLASNLTEATSSKTMGLVTSNVAANGFTDVVTEGILSGLNTSSATAGDPVWLGTNGNLRFGLSAKPSAPSHLVFIGIVTRVNANNGEIFVKVQNGFELNEIHDVDLKTNIPVNGEILGFNGTLWVNKTIAGWLGYTPQAQLNGTGFVKASGTTITYDNTSYYQASNPNGYISTYTETDTLASVTGRGNTTTSNITVGSLIIPSFETATNVLSFRSGIPDGTNVGIRAKAIATANRDGLELLGYNGIDFTTNNGANVAVRISGNGNVHVGGSTSSYKFHVAGGQYGTYLKGGDLGTGSDILRLVDASNNTKYLARGDGKHFFTGDTDIQGNLTVSGTLKASGYNKTNWDTAFGWGSHASAGYVPQARTITINGTSYDLSANRSWTVSAGISGLGTTGKIPLFTGSTALGDSSLTELSTYVNLTKPLTIASSTATSGQGLNLSLNNSGSTGTTLYVFNAGTGNLAQFQKSNNTAAFLINASGNVGIGTTLPNQKLTVDGNVRTIGVGNGFLLDTTGAQYTNGMKVVNNYETAMFTGRGSGGHVIAGDTNIRFGFSYDYTTGEKMRITSGGKVLIGTTGDVGDYKLQVNGSILAIDSIYSNGDVIAYASSDIRLKDNILPIKNALEKVKKIGGYTFDWNNKQTTYEGHDVGVIAQEIEAVLPEVVTTRDNGYKAVKYEKLTALLIESIKEQQVQIERLELLINKLTK